jgi:hypothetical protein
MQSPIILINIMLIIGACIHVQTTPIFQKNSSFTEHNNNTNESRVESHQSICISNNDCYGHSWCNKDTCECRIGWITWDNGTQCSYKQISKLSTFILSLLFGSAGIDWFILSRKDSLYILTGILKLLILIAGCIWGRLAVIDKTKTPVTVIGCLGGSLYFISFIWWMRDWIRILFDNFPDGNGAPLV